jgi:hypothetical protein
LSLTFAEAPVSGVMLRQLGTPRGWSADDTPEGLLGPVVRQAAMLARQLAMEEGAGMDEPTDEDDESGKLPAVVKAEVSSDPSFGKVAKPSRRKAARKKSAKKRRTGGGSRTTMVTTRTVQPVTRKTRSRKKAPRTGT